MKKYLVSFFISMMPAFSNAGLVEVFSSQFIRDGGAPKTENIQVELKNSGEIRVSNASLENSQIEISSSTEIVINGQILLKPFSLPPGGSNVFDLEAGTYEVSITLRGKPGGGVKVRFLENKPDAPVQGKGWQLLADGTVLHKKTGLIWHRNAASPGLWNGNQGSTEICTDAASADVRFINSCQMSISEYVKKLNEGQFGTDPIFGNAGHTDWRAPCASEFLITLDHRVAAPPLEGKDGEVNISSVVDAQSDWIRGGYLGGMQFGDPIYSCYDQGGGDSWFGFQCQPEFAVDTWITNSPVGAGRGNFHSGIWGYLSFPMFPEQGTFIPYIWYGSVWPVRGESTLK